MSHTAEVPDLDFLDLLDVPSDFVGVGDYVVVVAAGEDGLSFRQYVPASQLLDKAILPSTPTAGQILAFNAISDQWEAVDNIPGGVPSHFDLTGDSIGVNTHAVIDTHLADATIHFLEGDINHSAINGVGSNSHGVIDSHLANSLVHFLEGDIDHANIQGIGVNAHSVLDSHLANALLHFLEGDIRHSYIQEIGVNDHPAIDTHLADATVHFTEASISHENIQDIGTNSHPAIDTHIAAVNNPHSVTPAQVGNTTAQWNADQLQGRDITTDTPNNDEILRYNTAAGEWQTYFLVVGSEYSCKAHLTSDQTVSRLTWTALAWGDTVWDTQNYWAVGTPTRLTIPAGQSGRYAVRGNCIWETITEDSSTQSRLYLNGVAIPASHSGQYINKAAGGATWLPTANLMVYDLWLNAGDYIEFYVWLSVSTASAIDALGDSDENYASWLSIERIE